MKKFTVKLIPSLQKEIQRIKDKKQLRMIQKGKDKITKLGLNALNILYVRNKFVLGEVKYKRPPYRLYVIYDKSQKVFFLISWVHKKQQRIIIEKLKETVEKLLIRSIDLIYKL